MKKPTNTVASDANIGRNVRIWNYAYVGSKTVVGDDVKIGSLAHVDYDVKIGSGTKTPCTGPRRNSPASIG